MSTQRTKKKRLGSHRRVANQNETPKADELHVMDSTSVAQCHIPEENSESLSILSNPDSQPETQHPPSPDLTLSRRKLGSRRKNKGLHVKDSTNETYHEHREEVEENSKGNEAQSERQEELSKGSGEDISATHDSSLYSALTSGYSCEVQNPTTTKCSEDVLENLITQSGNQKADQDENETNSEGTSYSCKLLETILEVTDKSGTLQSEEVKENTHHVDSSHLTSSSTLSCPTADQQLISQSDSREMPEELLSVYSATEEENREREEDTNLLMQDGNLQSNYLMSESHEESVVPGFSTTAEITTDKNSLRQNTEFECSVEQGTSSLPTEELPADENPNKQFSLPLDSQPQDTSVRIEEQTNTNFNPTLNRRKLGSRRRNKGQQHVNDHETKEDVVENIRGNGAFETTQTSSVINTAVLVSPMETTLEGTDNSDNHQTERLSGQIKEIAHLVDNSALHSSTLHPTPSDDQQLINQLNIREMPHEEFSRVDFVTDTERKEREEDTDLLRQWGILQSNNLVSESHVISDDVNVHQPTEMQEIHLTECSPGSLINDSTENSEIHFANLTDQAEVSDTYQSVAESHHKPKEEHVEDITGNEALQTMSSALQTIQEELSPEADQESLIPKSEYLQEGHDERETDFKVEMSDKSMEATLEEMDKSDTLQSEEVNNTHSEETVIEVHEQEIKPTQIQEIHEGDYTFEDVTHVTAENSDSCSGNLTDQDEVRPTYQSELLVKSVDDPDPMQDVSDPDDKQDQHPIKESSMEVSDQIHEGNIAQDTNKSQTSDIERADTALSRVYENEMEESKSSLQTLESETNAPSDSTPQDNSLKMDKQNGNDLNPIGNRRKLGSTRRNKGRQHFKGSGAESYHKPTEDVVGNTTDNEALETTKMPLMVETEVQETSVETMLEGKDKFDLSHTEDISDKIKENALVTTSELTSISVYSSPTVDQQVIDNSNVREMENGELPGVSSATDTESRERDEDTDLLRQANNLVCESHLKSEGVESSNIQEISTEESSRGQHTEPEGSVEQARLSSPKEELSTNEEQNEHFSLCEVRGAQHSEDAVKKVHEEEEVKPTQIQEIHLIDYSSVSVIHDATENSEIYSANLTDQEEVRPTYQSELLVKSIDDPAPVQDVSDPDDKQDEHPTKQSSMGVSDQTDEDNLAQDTKKSQTSDIERADTALSQAYENEGRVEDYIKPTAEQTSHQEKQVLLSEMEESESSLQTLESETNAPSDSQPQDNSVQIDRQNGNDLNPIGNRRKLGSTRRNKGRQHFKGSGAESYHKPTEDVVGNTTDNEALETTKMSLMIETEVQETSVETMLEGKDKFDLSHTEDISDKIKENALVTTSELTSISVYSSPTVDQQVIDNSNVREMENEELPGVSSATDTESRERDEDTDLLRQANNLVCESHLKSEGVESSNIQEISTEESSRGQHTEPEGSVEQARLSSPKEELSTNEEQNEHFSLSEVRGARHSEDAVKKVHEEEEVKPTQIQEIHLIDYSSESVIHDATENSEIYSANLTDQEEVRPTYQSELLVKSIDDPSPTQQVSGPDDKQDEHPTKESSVEVLDRIDEDYLVQDTNKSQPSNIERADTALCQVYEKEGRVEDDIKPTAEQTCHQEKERHLSEMEESKSSLQTLESEPNVPLNLQPQDNSVKIDEQNDTNFNPIGNRRKLGSSRRNKGRQHNKSSGAASYHHPAKEDVEDIKGNEDLQTTMSLALQTSQEDNEQDIILSVIGANTLNSESMSDYSSEVQNRATTTEMSDKSMEATLEEMDKSDTLQSEEVNDTRSEDTVNEVHEQEIKPTQIQEIHEGDYFFESVTHVTAENSDSCSGNLTDQDEVRHTYQSELLVKSIDDPVPMQDVSDPDDKQDQHPIKQSSMEVSDQTDEDNLAQDTNKSQTSDIERADTALSQAYENEGRVEDYIKPTAVQTSHQEKQVLLSEMEESESSLQTLESETNAPSDSQPQDNSLKMDKQNGNDLNPTGNRRKLGSTRRNKGRQHDKGSGAESYHKPTEDVVGNTTDNEALETTKMSLTIETEVQETSMEIILEGKDKFDLSQTEDISDNIMENAHVTTSELTSISVYSSPTVDQQVTDQSNDREMLSSATDTESKEKDEDTDLLRQWGILEAINLVNVSHLNSEGIESSITPEITTEKNSFRQHTEPGFTVEQATVSSPKEELSTNEEQNEHFNFSEVKSGQQSEEAVREVHGEEEIKLPEMQKMHQFDYSSIKESSPSLQTLQSEVRSPLDSQPMDNSQSIKEETDSGFKSTGNRRKLGSSRRNKVRQHIPDSVPEPYTKLKEEVVENTRGDKGSETQQIPLGTETAKQEELKDHTDVGFKPAEKIRTIRSTVKKEEKMPGEDTTLSQNIMDSSTIVTTDTTLRSDKNDSLKPTEEVSEERKEHIKEPENLTVLTGYDTIKIDLIQSEKDSEETSIDVQGPGQVEVREECEDPANKDHAAQEINISNVVTHAELSSACENKSDTWATFDIGHQKKLTANPAGDVSEESGISTATDAVNSQQDIQEKNPVGNSENLLEKVKQRKRKMGSTRRTQLNRKQEGETHNKDETFESNFGMEVDVRNLDRMEVEELPLIATTAVSQKENAQSSLRTVYKEQQETNETGSVHDKQQMQQSSTSDLQTVESNIKAGIDDSMVHLPEWSASHNEEVAYPVTFVHGVDVRDSEGNVDFSVVPPQLDDFASTEMRTTSMVVGRNGHSVNQLLSSNTEGAVNTDSDVTLSFSETAQSTQNDEGSTEVIKVLHDQALNSAEAPTMTVADLAKVNSVVKGGVVEENTNAQASAQEPNNVNEEAQDTNVEMKNASPNFSSTNRRRKLGSTRRNLESRSKGEYLHQKQEVDNEATATNVGDVLSEGVPGIKEKELQLHSEHKDGDSEQRKEKVFETVEYSHIGESQLEPVVYQTVEENPDSLSQLVETEHQLSPDHLPATPSTSPKHDVMPESAAGGRRRKMGSHRKSHGHQRFENQTAREDRIDVQKVRDVSLTDESAIKTAKEHTEGSLSLDEILEVDESNQKTSSNISISKATEHTGPKSEKAPKLTPVQYPQAEIRLGQESRKKVSFAGADVRSKSNDVLLVGNSNVGKTSFMKRAQSGKFSLDLPASVGLDSCMWTVVVDGKPVVLQLWDTAGQERFHSITRQVFHKARAFLLMYDISSSQSFSAVSYWANCIQEGAAENMPILLLGNKSDCTERQVKTEEGESLAKEYNFEFMECSAATGENVIQSLETVARMLSQKVDTTEEALVLHKEPPQKKRSGCC